MACGPGGHGLRGHTRPGSRDGVGTRLGLSAGGVEGLVKRDGLRGVATWGMDSGGVVKKVCGCDQGWGRPCSWLGGHTPAPGRHASQTWLTASMRAHLQGCGGRGGRGRGRRPGPVHRARAPPQGHHPLRARARPRRRVVVVQGERRGGSKREGKAGAAACGLQAWAWVGAAAAAAWGRPPCLQLWVLKELRNGGALVCAGPALASPHD